MRIELSSLHDSLRSTMIYVTHDQVEAMTLANKIVVLQSGVIEQVGSPLELYNNPRNLFVAGFIGSPKMNFFPVTVAAISDSGTTVSLPGGASITIPVIPDSLSVGDRATLGIRPEHVRVDRSKATMNGEVLVVERLGGTTFLYVRLPDGEMLTVQADGDDPSRVRDHVPIYINENLCHLFDQQGEAISKSRRHHLNVNESHEQQYQNRVSS
jgi:multiple sugar transport system ATP-binding protein